MNQLSIPFSPTEQRDIGMAQAMAGAERAEPNWGEQAFDFLESFAKRNPTFISEDVSDATREDSSFPQPPTDRAWGSVYRRAARDGLIVVSGVGRSRRRHASVCPLWTSLVYGL